MSARDDYGTDTVTQCYETMCDEIDRLRAVVVPLHDAWLKAKPPCPTCGGRSMVEDRSNCWHGKPCPDCFDGVQPFDKWVAGVAAPSDGVRRIAAERQRQVALEGWTDGHDDSHPDAALSRAALCYTDEAARQVAGYRSGPRPTWPWAVRWWKPSDEPVRNLVKAGALIAAEIDRLLRQIGGTR